MNGRHVNEQAPLVTVVIPAYNAEATIERTLDSVIAQTYRQLEIIVVDDGSKDSTLEIVRRYAAQDARFTVIAAANAGVATARNRGIEAGHGEFVAPVDADDLWHPEKIEKQVKALVAAGPSVAFVYSPARIIDADDRVIGTTRCLGVRGSTVHQHLYLNYVGNGSALLARRSVLLELGGYARALQDCKAHGCEDMLLQLRMAVRHQVEVVPEYLVGYRHIDGNMSSNHQRMLRSYRLMLAMFAAENPEVVGPGYAWGEASYLHSLFRKSVLGRNWEQARFMLKAAAVIDPVGTGWYVVELAWNQLMKRLRRRGGAATAATVPPSACYADFPAQGDGPVLGWFMARRMARLQRLDQQRELGARVLEARSLPQLS